MNNETEEALAEKPSTDSASATRSSANSPSAGSSTAGEQSSDKAAEEPITDGEFIEADDHETLKERLLTPEHWLRLVFMLLFGVILVPAAYVMGAVVLFQFIWFMLSGERNDKLHNFGRSLVSFIQQALAFLNFNTEEKPFPFKDWPEA